MECPICLALCAETAVPSCGHAHCFGCLVRWVNEKGTSATCPCCRAVLMDRTPSRFSFAEQLLVLVCYLFAVCNVMINAWLFEIEKGLAGLGVLLVSPTFVVAFGVVADVILEKRLQRPFCALCFDTLERVDVARLPCGHAFHLSCFLRYARVGTRACPACG